mgnify:CR=1 FL=1|tara:strand:- start:269 stop:493 length:225 start_codon:yes stop_codon:yes gene_type:complete
MDNINEENRKSREKLYKKLRYGDMGTIAASAKTSRSSVWRWFKGTNNDSTIEDAVNALLNLRREKLEQLIKDQA